MSCFSTQATLNATLRRLLLNLFICFIIITPFFFFLFQKLITQHPSILLRLYYNYFFNRTPTHPCRSLKLFDNIILYSTIIFYNPNNINNFMK